jgi:hypothetical protein
MSASVTDILDVKQSYPGYYLQFVGPDDSQFHVVIRLQSGWNEDGLPSAGIDLLDAVMTAVGAAVDSVDGVLSGTNTKIERIDQTRTPLYIGS